MISGKIKVNHINGFKVMMLHLTEEMRENILLQSNSILH